MSLTLQYSKSVPPGADAISVITASEHAFSMIECVSTKEGTVLNINLYSVIQSFNSEK